jgi:hypothetical protein
MFDINKTYCNLWPVEANSTGGQGSRRAVAPSDDDDCNLWSRNMGKKTGITGGSEQTENYFDWWSEYCTLY